VTEQEWLVVLTSVCGHCDYKLLLGTAKHMPSDDRWFALLRNAKDGAIKNVSVSDSVNPEDAILHVFEQLALPTTA